MNIALATCKDLPDWEIDDAPLHAALNAAGVTVSMPVWSDKTIDWSMFDLTIIRTTWDYQDRLDEFLNWTMQADALGRLRNRPQLLRWNANKNYLRDLYQKGIPIAPTEWLEDEVDIESVACRRGWKKLFIKPMVGASAIGAMRFDVSDCYAAQDLLSQTLSKCGMLLQPYIQTVENEGEVSLLYFGGRYSHAVVKIPPDGDFRVQDDYGAKDYPFHPDQDLRDLSRQALTLLPSIPLYARVDFLKFNGSWVLNELELIEPSLFFRHGPNAASLFVDAIASEVSSCQTIK